MPAPAPPRARRHARHRPPRPGARTPGPALRGVRRAARGRPALLPELRRAPRAAAAGPARARARAQRRPARPPPAPPAAAAARPATRVAAALAARGRRRHPADARLRDRGRRGGGTARRRDARLGRRARDDRRRPRRRRPPRPPRSRPRARAPRSRRPAAGRQLRARHARRPTAPPRTPRRPPAPAPDTSSPTRRRTARRPTLDVGRLRLGRRRHAGSGDSDDARAGDVQARLDRRAHRAHDGRGPRRPLPHAVSGGDAAPEGAAALGLQAGAARRPGQPHRAGQRPAADRRSSAATARPTTTSTCRPGRAACSPRTSRRCPAS